MDERFMRNSTTWRPLTCRSFVFRSTSAGFTLVEILAALAVLATGLAGVLSIIYAGVKQSTAAADQNAAAIIIPQAVDLIRLQHLITADTPGADPSQYGAYIETLDGGAFADSTPTGDAKFPLVKIGKTPGADLKQVGPISILPTNKDEVFAVGDHLTFSETADSYKHSSTYRVRYRLEKHENWRPHDDDGKYLTVDENAESPYLGVYVLTLAVYRASPGNTLDDVQVSDPLVFYLRDKVVRP